MQHDLSFCLLRIPQQSSEDQVFALWIGAKNLHLPRSSATPLELDCQGILGFLGWGKSPLLRGNTGTWSSKINLNQIHLFIMRTEPCAQIQYVKTKSIMCKSMPTFLYTPHIAMFLLPQCLYCSKLISLLRISQPLLCLHIWYIVNYLLLFDKHYVVAEAHAETTVQQTSVEHPVKPGPVALGLPLLGFCFYSQHWLIFDGEATQTWLQIFATVQ